MCNAGLDQLTRLESRLEGAHEDALEHLDQLNLAEQLLAVGVVDVVVYVREAPADHLLILAVVGRAGLLLAVSRLLLVQGWPAEARIVISLLNLGDRDLVLLHHLLLAGL